MSNIEDLFNETVGADDIFGGSDNKIEEKFEPRSLDLYKKALAKVNEDNDAVTEFDILMDDMNSVHAIRMNRLLGNMTDSNFRDYYLKLLPYVKSKIKAIDGQYIEPSELTQIQVVVINNSDKK